MNRILITIFLLCSLGSSFAQSRIKDSIQLALDLNQVSRVHLSNINGSITVKGTQRDQAELRGVRTLSAMGEESMKDAQADVQVTTLKKDGHLFIYLNIPRFGFEVDGEGKGSYAGCYDSPKGMRKPLGYSFTYDFVLYIPHNTSLEISTINDGDLSVEDVYAAVQAKNINGSIELHNIGRVSEAHTINGDIHITQREIPTQDAFFSTINGDVKLWYPENLSAEVLLMSRRGELLTAYDWKALSPETEKITEEKGKSTYKIHSWNRIQIGNGGPKIHMETLNGDLYVLKDK
ncbi:MAG: DUF4097 family beta strand repeat-containing protein [Bacteroidota bacterium]